jgi:hypothetical protein
MPANLKSNISSLYMRQYVTQLFACRVANLLAELFLFLVWVGEKACERSICEEPSWQMKKILAHLETDAEAGGSYILYASAASSY